MTTELTKAAQQALEALKETLLFCETFSNRWDGETGAHPFGMVERARAAVPILTRALTQRPAAQEVDEQHATQQATPAQEAESAGLVSANGHLSILLNESTQMLAQLRGMVDALHDTWSNGGRPERGEFPLLDRVDDWLNARPPEMLEPQPATPEPVGDVRCEGCGYMTHHREHMGCVRAAKQHTHPAPDGWTEADADAARLAMELECLLLDTKDTAAVSRWWKSANEALDLHRARLAAAQAKGADK